MDIIRYCSDFFATLLQVRHLVGAAIVFVLWWGFWFVINLKGKWGEFEGPENRTQW
jgi:hypothetical protein